MRGTRLSLACSSSICRIIPAYAGNTRPGPLAARSVADRPRVCGEHCPRSSLFKKTGGSSPRMRGTRKSPNPHIQRCRIIPAYAGNTVTFFDAVYMCADHPRVCGEHQCKAPCPPNVHGSSPRMRGTLVHYGPHGPRRRIIPAYAGNTFIGVTRSRNRPDHPRVCGEHPRRSATSLGWDGSSPRMRGTHP